MRERTNLNNALDLDNNKNNNYKDNNNTPLKRKADWPLVLLSLVLTATIAVYLLVPGEGSFFSGFSKIAETLLPLSGVLAGIWALTKVGLKGLQGKSILFLTIGFFGWFLGYTLWMIYDYATVSIADLPFLLGYIFVFIGILFGIMMSRPDIFSDSKKTILFIFIIIALIGAYFYFFPLSWDREISFLENVGTAGYIFGDLLVILPTLLLCYSLLKGSLSSGWIILLVGLILTVIGDLWYMRNYELYESSAKNFIDLAWRSAEILFVYAMVHFVRAHNRAHELMKQQVENRVLKLKTKRI